MSNHLQLLTDVAVREELAPLGEMLDRELGGLDDDQALAVSEALRQAFVAGVRAGAIDSVADIEEQTGLRIELDLRVR